MEFPHSFWERPPGLGLVPLHIIFTICSQMHQWLSLSPENIVVRGELGFGISGGSKRGGW